MPVFPDLGLYTVGVTLGLAGGLELEGDFGTHRSSGGSGVESRLSPGPRYGAGHEP